MMGMSGMRFTVRSLGGKLIISAALTLLLCMVLFAATSWYLLKTLYEHQATSDARLHLALIQKAYNVQTSSIIDTLSKEANGSKATTSLLQTISNQLLEKQYRFSDLAFVLKNHRDVSDLLKDSALKKSFANSTVVDQAFLGKAASAIQSISNNTTTAESS